MNLRKLCSTAVVAVLTLAAASPLLAGANDYPTIDRIEFVHSCQRENPDRPPHEMLYKCSCVIDKMAESMPYEDFVEASTAFYASSIAGERGQVIRNERVSKGLADQFRELLGKARKSCFIS